MTREVFTSRTPGHGSAAHADHHAGASIGKRTLVDQLDFAPSTVQRRGAPGAAAHDPEDVKAAAAHGTSGAAGALPHLGVIQAAFGRHDVRGVRAHVGGPASEGAAQMGAQAFATGDRVAFAAAPDVHTAAHEAAHVVQQRAGVALKGGVGAAGDPYEQNADHVADLVVQGKSAEAALDGVAGTGGGTGDAAVQRLIVPIGDLAPIEGTFQQKSDAHIIEQSTARLEAVTKDNVGHLGSHGELLAKLARSEELQIVAHGGSPLDTEVAETYGGYTPTQLAARLVANGLKPSYNGMIYLNGCNTATTSPERKSYAERFQTALLANHKIHAGVRGNAGGSRVLKDGQTGFRKTDPTSTNMFEQLQHEMSQMKRAEAEMTQIVSLLRSMVKLEGNPQALELTGLDDQASESQVIQALSNKAKTSGEKTLKSAQQVNLGLDDDALFSAQPDKIVTLPAPPTDNEILVRFSLLIIAAMTCAKLLPFPINYLMAILCIGFAIRSIGRELTRRGGR